MPVRNFEAGGVVRTAIGNANPAGALTFVALVKFKDSTEWMIARQDASHANAATWESLGYEGGTLHSYPTSSSTLKPPLNEWLLVGDARPVGGKEMAWYYRFSTSELFSFEAAINSTPTYGGVASEIQLGRWNAGEPFNGLYAAAAVYGVALTQANFEGLVSAPSIKSWLLSSPLALWMFNQALVAEPVNDQTGGGANQISIEGTTVTAEEPPIPYISLPSIALPAANRAARGLILR